MFHNFPTLVQFDPFSNLRPFILSMTVTMLNLNNALPFGVTYDYETPCKGAVFTNDVLEDLFSSKLPELLEAVRTKWNNIPNGQVSGLAPIETGGPFDQCNGAEGFDVNLFSRHGGPIPITGGAPDSRGVAEVWPHGRAKWTQVGTRWVREIPFSEAAANGGGHTDKGAKLAKPKWSKMSWDTDDKIHDDPKKNIANNNANDTFYVPSPTDGYQPNSSRE